MAVFTWVVVKNFKYNGYHFVPPNLHKLHFQVYLRNSFGYLLPYVAASVYSIFRY